MLIVMCVLGSHAMHVCMVRNGSWCYIVATAIHQTAAGGKVQDHGIIIPLIGCSLIFEREAWVIGRCACDLANAWFLMRTLPGIVRELSWQCWPGR